MNDPLVTGGLLAVSPFIDEPVAARDLELAGWALPGPVREVTEE